MLDMEESPYKLSSSDGRDNNVLTSLVQKVLKVEL